jgi:hypothetical protein
MLPAIVNTEIVFYKGVAIATVILIGFSHPKARYFLLLRQNKVPKEKATRMPLVSCALSFLSGFAKRNFLSLWQSAASLPRPFSGYSR